LTAAILIAGVAGYAFGRFFRRPRALSDAQFARICKFGAHLKAAPDQEP
jgi:hypothetical protein